MQRDDEWAKEILRRKTEDVSPTGNGSIRRPVKREFERLDSDSEALIVEL